jgi:hypothetical protein
MSRALRPSIDSGSLPEDWTDEQKDVFGKVYRFMQKNQSTHCHPAMPKPDDEHWNTICFNSAWLAASIAFGDELTICDEDDAVLASTEQATLNG